MIEVAVVGAGALGLCTAFALTELGVRAVTVIERDQVAGASSGLSVGIIETQYLDPLAIEVRVRSMELFRRFELEHGLEIRRNGYLRLAHSRDDLDAFVQSVAIQHELGVRDARVLDRADLPRVVPDLECGGTRLAGTWAGLYPLSPDGLPVVGPYAERPAIVAALGAGGSGLQSSPALGHVAAEWIVHGESRTIPAATSLLPGRPGLPQSGGRAA
jgi:glycine/D-amino acid oxidase-like deaminating enzyme